MDWENSASARTSTVIYNREHEPESVQYQKLIPLLLGELQQLKKETDRLARRVEELESHNGTS